MHIHILGICGTFMGGIALLAKGVGHRVTGSDLNVYPPMSEQLTEAGIELMQGYEPSHLENRPDQVVIGNALSRGNPAVEYILDNSLAYRSGPQWLAENILADRWVLGVAGTHGKTSVSSMLTWVLNYSEKNPGFLIGGVPENFGVSARLGDTPFFVVEADEYDSAFFDKRSKFIHYRPRTVILNNLEFDHADIFPDLASIQRQFHHLVRTIPGRGRIILPDHAPALNEVLEQGCWTPCERFGREGKEWSALLLEQDGSRFEILHKGRKAGLVSWELLGLHNVDNALATVAAAHHAGVDIPTACEALGQFKNVKRRLEIRGKIDGITVYDDFAHHPTAIRTTIDGLRRRVGNERIVAILEPRSNTMRMGVHSKTLGPSLEQADSALVYREPRLAWDLTSALDGRATVYDSIEEIIDTISATVHTGDHVLIMSNGGFGGIHKRLLEALRARRH